MKKFLILIIGIISYLLSKFFKTKKKLWIYGSSHGERFSDNSKYFFNHIRKNNTNIKSIWITRSKRLYKELKHKNIPVVHNVSLKGIFYCLIADVVVFSTSRDDLLFVYPKLNRKIVNLWHGMPMKKIVFDHKPHLPKNRNIKSKIWDKFVVGFQHSDVDLIPATSSFFKNILQSAFKSNNVYVTGQARTDAFFEWDSLKIRTKYGFSTEDTVITYMPTHRGYGSGLMNPKIFIENLNATSYFKKNKIKIIWKFHPNMINKMVRDDINFDEDVFRDMTFVNCEPQELLFISDMLITDYSSCYIDYLFLKRPIAFYLYDNYKEEDNELYFSPKDHKIGGICFSEKDLFNWIKLEKENPKFEYGPDLLLYHKKIDNNSCSNIAKLVLN